MTDTVDLGRGDCEDPALYMNRKMTIQLKETRFSGRIFIGKMIILK
jgi:hypothetical protein